MMPIFDFRCEDCNNEFEDFLDAGEAQCNKCNSLNVTKLITGNCALIFKGDGFYKPSKKED